MTGRILCIDAQVSGVAGDMLVGALLDLGADFARLTRELSALDLAGYHLSSEETMRGVVRARRFHVQIESSEPHELEPHSHTHGHGHSHGSRRPWRTIRDLLRTAAIPERARERATAVFLRLAEEEATIHSVPVEDVTFHEVGGIDAIVDIVGVALCLEHLGVDEVFLHGSVALGGGLVSTEHGLLPVPAPATVALLGNVDVRPGRFSDGELTTPTGAALLAALTTPGPAPVLRLERVGYGAGTRNPPDRPNVVRALMGTRSSTPASPAVEVLESNLDDLPGEQVPLLIEALLRAGALDAFAAPVLMKKGRPGLFVQALVSSGDADRVTEAFLRHGSTFGVRRTSASRTVLDRRHDEVETPWGRVRVKIRTLQGEVLQVAPEFEDIKSIAESSGKSAGEVHRAAIAAWTAKASSTGSRRGP